MPGRKKDQIGIVLDIAALMIVLGLAVLLYRNGDIFIPMDSSGWIAALVVIAGLLFYRRRRKKLFASGIAEIDRMDNQMFKQLLLKYFRRQGHTGGTIKENAGYEADLILSRGNVKYLIEAKRQQKKVGLKTVQQIADAVRYYEADKGIVITTGYFTKEAWNLARSTNIELWDRKKLIALLSRAEGRTMAVQIIEEMPHQGLQEI